MYLVTLQYEGSYELYFEITATVDDAMEYANKWADELMAEDYEYQVGYDESSHFTPGFEYNDKIYVNPIRNESACITVSFTETKGAAK